MGIIYKPQLPMYWSTNALDNTPVFSEVINRNRFHVVLKFLHFNSNEDPNYNPNDENRDCLHKVRLFIELMGKQFREVYFPRKNLSVDVSLVLYKGRLFSNSLSE